MADEIAAVRAEVLHWRLLAALTWQVGTALLAGSLWNAAQLRTWTRGPVATILSLRAALTICVLAALQAVTLLVLRQVQLLPCAEVSCNQTSDRPAVTGALLTEPHHRLNVFRQPCLRPKLADWIVVHALESLCKPRCVLRGKHSQGTPRAQSILADLLVHFARYQLTTAPRMLLRS